MTDHSISHEGQTYDIDALTCEDLRVHFGTGQAVRISGSGRNRISKYRTGVQTNIGDMETSVWMDLMRHLIARLGETELQEHLRQWVKENCAWIHTSEEVEQHSLELHAARIFDNPAWTGYMDFNRRYRPNLVLTDSPNGGEKAGSEPQRLCISGSKL